MKNHIIEFQAIIDGGVPVLGKVECHTERYDPNNVKNSLITHYRRLNPNAKGVAIVINNDFEPTPEDYEMLKSQLIDLQV